MRSATQFIFGECLYDHAVKLCPETLLFMICPVLPNSVGGDQLYLYQRLGVLHVVEERLQKQRNNRSTFAQENDEQPEGSIAMPESVILQNARSTGPNSQRHGRGILLESCLGEIYCITIAVMYRDCSFVNGLNAIGNVAGYVWSGRPKL